MKDIIVRLIWKFLGYGCCRPLHSHEVQGILDQYQKNINAGLQSQLSDQRAQLFEYFKQSADSEKENVLKVRLVK